jgi:tetratricopeptide (TPR) repeat protein
MEQVPPPREQRFSRRQVLRILGISERQLASWEHQGFVRPSGVVAPKAAAGGEQARSSRDASRDTRPGAHSSKDSAYTFSDIVSLRTLLQLRRNGVPTARIRLALSAIQTRLGEGEKPWSELRLRGRGRRLWVQFEGATMEALTGQLQLPYRQEGPAKVRPLDRAHSGRGRAESEQFDQAERFFRAGLRYEERKETLPKAIRAYQRAVELNPHAVGAFINLGTLYYKLARLQEAEECYRSALLLHPGYALVQFNLGNVFDERSEWDKARRHYEEAIRLDPSYPDPHFNLALVYEKLGLHGKARLQWRAYLKLDSHSRWASYARQQLDNTPLRLIAPKPSSENRP